MIARVISGHALSDAGLRTLASEWGGAHPIGVSTQPSARLRARADIAASQPTRAPMRSTIRQEQP